VPLANATVYVLNDRRAGALTGPTGRFTLVLPGDTATIVAARIGFAPETLAVRPSLADLTFRLHEAPITLAPTVVATTRDLSAASSSEIRQLDVQLRPRESSQELLRLVPGLVIAQHAGGGKAEQIFLRGFDADHGTDVAISVDGTPVNMLSHGHGQGYADLHYVMPEVIDHADIRKGPYDAEDGDLATAGAVAFATKDRVDARSVTVRGGSFATEHGIVLMPFGGDAAQAGGYVAASVHGTNGPFDHPQDYGRTNVFAKFTAPVGGAAQFVASASAFGAHWDASGQVPERAVTERLIDRFGSIDPSEGGGTQRFDLNAGLRSTSGGDDQWEVRAYAVRYTFGLFSDFTFFLVDTLRGDEVNQTDNRTEFGARAVRTGRNAPLGLPGAWRAGVGERSDFIDVGLNHTQDRSFLSHVQQGHVQQDQLYTWGDETLSLSSRVRLQLGVRADGFRFGLTDLLGDTAIGDVAHGSGTRWVGVVSPKANLAIDVARGTEVYANAGYGFHSNDARDVVLAAPGSTVLPRAFGAELGARHTWAGGSIAAALWGTDLQSELVYNGDLGTTEPSGRTRRVGVDLEGRVRLLDWLWADADVDLSRGRFVDAPTGADFIPLAPTITSSGGLTVRDVGPLSAGVRYRLVGSRPADTTNAVVARGYTLAEVFARYEFARMALVGAIDNVLGASWNEAQFATTSRLRGEPLAGITQLNFTPGAPRSVQLGVEYRF
jgi:TonB-dependent receptor-like protein